MTRLDGKTALITGSTDGVGRVVAKRLGEAGARVLVHGRNRERGERLVAEIKEGGKGSPDGPSGHSIVAAFL
jgi:NAD(P)-dependent dehydrogenase (short-subunit alcohol dehydrogenase family)